MVANRVFGDSISWGFPSILYPVGDKLAVLDLAKAPHLVAVDLATGAIAFRTGTHGLRRGEFWRPSFVVPASIELGLVWVYDPRNRRFTLVNLRTDAGDHYVGSFRYYPGDNVYQPLLLGHGVLSNGTFLDFTLLSSDRRARRISRIRVNPPYDIKEVGSEARVREGNSTRMAVRPSNGQLALAYVRASRVDFFTREGAHLGTIPGPRGLRGGFETRASQLRWAGDAEVGYGSAFGTERYVYASFCGCTNREQFDRQKPRLVHVFNWAGDFVAEILLDRAVFGIAVSSNDSLLFGGAMRPYPMVAEWILPPALR